jgi:hypothetical protein
LIRINKIRLSVQMSSLSNLLHYVWHLERE